jgi:peptide/nickel transport system permease protein
MMQVAGGPRVQGALQGNAIRTRPGLLGRMARRPVTIVGMVLVSSLLGFAALAPALTPYDPLRANNDALLPPLSGPHHYFGTTSLGRDLFSAVIFGARVSLTVGITVALLATAIGVVVGTIAGYRGGWLDDALMRLTELFIVIPRFFLAIVVVALFGHSLANLIVVIAVLSWPPIARVVRAEFLSLREQEFVQAARSIGSSARRIAFREILPNALGPAIVVGSLQVSQAILLEASLSFLGLGDPDLPSWGDLLVDAQRYLTRAPWLTLIPGAAITIAVIGFNLLGDGLAEALDPRLANRID